MPKVLTATPYTSVYDRRTGSETPLRSWLAEFLCSTCGLACEYLKEYALTVGNLRITSVVPVRPMTSLDDVAARHRARIGRTGVGRQGHPGSSRLPGRDPGDVTI